MRIQRTLATCALLFGTATLAQAQNAHLNEIYCSMTGTDFDEYIELIGTPGASLDNYVVLVLEGEGGGQGILDRVWNLTGSVVPPSGYFTMANIGSQITFDYTLDQGPHTLSMFYTQGQNNLENGTGTVYLIEASSALAIMDLETIYYNGTIDADLDLITILDTDPSYTIHEAVGMVNDDWVQGLDNVHDCAPTLGPDGSFFPAGVYRPGDYPGDWCSDDFLVFGNTLDPKNTPGAMNPSAACTGMPSSSGCGGMTGGIGTNYCGPGELNTTGMPGVMTADGSEIAADMDVTITGSQLPPTQFAYFIGSTTQGFVAMPGGSSGNLCVIGTIARFNSQIGAITAAGEFSIVVDTQNIPLTPTVAIMAGDTWNFQCWHRDFIAMSGPTSNFTDGISITFQ
ncbi:MAG: hypothetical protein ACI8QC_003562 [Planctomycetota bacterium]|jgi:hypothetical protein